MWGGLKDYASGVFREPRFYGQNYNSFLEAFLAVPLFQLGYKPYTALPFVSMCLSIFPFYYLAFLSLYKRSVFYAIIIMSMPLLLPFEYGVITSMPRGFVTGMPFAALALTAIYFDTEQRFLFMSGFFSVLAFSINSNVALLVAPAMIYLLMLNWKSKRYYVQMGAGLLFGFSLHWAAAHFYQSHPFYNVHPLQLHGSWELMVKGLRHPDVFLNYNSPIFWQHGALWLLVMALFGVFFLWQKKVNAAIAVFAMLLLLCASFAIGKIYDGTNSLYFHTARMYLAFPLLIVFCFALAKPQYETPMKYWVLLLPNYFFYTQFDSMEKSIKDLIAAKANDVVIVSPVKPIVADCVRLNGVAKKYHVDLFVVVNHFYADAYASGCSACVEGFPKTLQSNFERRTWRLLEDEKTIYPTVMFIDMYQKLDTANHLLKKLPDARDLYLAANNKLPTMRLLDSLHVSYRRFK